MRHVRKEREGTEQVISSPFVGPWEGDALCPCRSPAAPTPVTGCQHSPIKPVEVTWKVR